MGQALSCIKAPTVGEGDIPVPVEAAAVDTLTVVPAKAAPLVRAVPVVTDGQSESSSSQSPQQSPHGAVTSSEKPTGCAFDRLGRPVQPNLPYEVAESGPPLPPCQEARLQSLHLTTLLNTAPKEDLQNILKLVCSIFKTNHALIALLFDRRVYITNGTGNFQEGDFPWRYSFCGWTMASEQHTVMVINDVDKDARFCTSPVAQKYNVKFYAGAPLVSSSGHRLGTLCFADNTPRSFDDASLRILCNFSELVTRELERDIALAEARQPQQQLTDAAAETAAQQLAVAGKVQGQQQLRSLEALTSAVLLVDTSQPEWVVLYASRGWQDLLQLCRQLLAGQASTDLAPGSSIVGKTLWPSISQQLLHKAAARPGHSQLEKLVQLVRDKQSFTLKGIRLSGFGGASFTLSFRPANSSGLQGGVSICLPSYVSDTQGSHVASDGMYFVTVHLQHNQTTGLATVAESPLNPSSNRTSSADDSSVLWPIMQQQQPRPSSTVGPDMVVLTSSQFRQAGNQGPLAVSLSSDSGWGSAETLNSNSNRLAYIPESPGASTSGSNLSISSSFRVSIDSVSSITATRMVCKKIEGLNLGGQIAAGSYGRVFRGDYFGTKVAVKVLDGSAVLRREAATGLCLEALLGEQLKHPNVVSTLAWAVVTGKERIPEAQKLWGETLQSGRPSIMQNKKAVQAAANPSAAAAPSGPVEPLLQDDASESTGQQVQQQQKDESVPQASSPDYDFFEETSSSAILDGQTWLVMEYMDKGCLQDAVDCGWLRESPTGRASLLKVIATATEIASGIMALHAAGILHGDLSAFNVLLTSNDASASLGNRGFVAKVSDFGLSRTLQHTSKVVTKTYGTITHMPPELLEQGIASKAADVYSFGVLLWQMVSSSRAWAGMSHQAVVKAVCIDKLQLQFPADAPEALVALGQACMSYDPDERPSFEDILEVLAPLNDMIVSAEVNVVQQGSGSGSVSGSGGKVLSL